MQDCDALRGDFGIAGIFSAGTAELLTEHDNSGQTDIDYVDSLFAANRLLGMGGNVGCGNSDFLKEKENRNRL